MHIQKSSLPMGWASPAPPWRLASGLKFIYQPIQSSSCFPSGRNRLREVEQLSYSHTLCGSVDFEVIFLLILRNLEILCSTWNLRQMS
jgi:hypothetical protein